MNTWRNNGGISGWDYLSRLSKERVIGIRYEYSQLSVLKTRTTSQNYRLRALKLLVMRLDSINRRNNNGNCCN